MFMRAWRIASECHFLRSAFSFSLRVITIVVAVVFCRVYLIFFFGFFLARFSHHCSLPHAFGYSKPLGFRQLRATMRRMQFCRYSFVVLIFMTMLCVSIVTVVFIFAFRSQLAREFMTVATIKLQ